MNHNQEKNQWIKWTKKDRDDGISSQDFKTVLINMLNINKDFKENINVVNGEMEDIKKSK